MILLTGYEPYDDYEANPSAAVARQLDGETVTGERVVADVLPVAFDDAADAVAEMIATHEPDAAVATGLAPGSTAVNVERVGINAVDCVGVPDNAGAEPRDERVDPDGPAAYFATLPTGEIVERLLGRGVPARLSNTAGTHLCNHLLYSTRAHVEREGLDIPVGFVHLPHLPEEAVRQAEEAAHGGRVPASMPLPLSIEAVRTVLECTVEGC